MSVVFVHDRKVSINKFGQSCIAAMGGTTVAIENLKPWILSTLKAGEFFEKRVGVAICSTQDRYNKAIGRELASSRMKLTKLTVQSIIEVESCLCVSLMDDASNIYGFVKYKAASEPFFISFTKGK